MKLRLSRATQEQTYVFQYVHLRLSSTTQRTRTSFVNRVMRAAQYYALNYLVLIHRILDHAVHDLINLSVCCFVSLRSLPVGFGSGGAGKSREIELGLRRKRSPMAGGPMPSVPCHMRAKRFSSTDIRGGCGGSLECNGSIWPTPSGCVYVWGTDYCEGWANA